MIFDTLRKVLQVISLFVPESGKNKAAATTTLRWLRGLREREREIRMFLWR